jgi:hypothetical protein
VHLRRKSRRSRGERHEDIDSTESGRGRRALFAGIVVLAAVAAPEAGAALPHVNATANAPLVAAVGDKLTVKATIAGTGVKIPVGLVFGNAAGSAKNGVKLGTGLTISHGDRIARDRAQELGWRGLLRPAEPGLLGARRLPLQGEPDQPVDRVGHRRATLQVTFTDKGEPGLNDTIGFTLWNGSKLLFSSEWNGAKTLERALDGGNTVVH